MVFYKASDGNLTTALQFVDHVAVLGIFIKVSLRLNLKLHVKFSAILFIFKSYTILDWKLQQSDGPMD